MDAEDGFVCVDDGLHDGQAEPVAVVVADPFAACLTEWVEEPLDLGGRDARSGVGDGDGGPARCRDGYFYISGIPDPGRVPPKHQEGSPSLRADVAIAPLATSRRIYSYVRGRRPGLGR